MHALFFYSNPTLTSPCTVLHRQSPTLASRTLIPSAVQLPLPRPATSSLPAKTTGFLPALHVRPRPCRLLPKFQSQSRSPDSESRGGAQTHPRVASVSQHGKETQTRDPRRPPFLPPFLTPPGSRELQGFRRRGDDCPIEHPARGEAGAVIGTLSCLRHACVIISRCH